MDTKQNKEKIARINEVLADLRFQNTACANEKNGTYYDYDGVIALLEQAVDRQKGTVRNPRPASLSEDMPWRETFADSDEEFDPYVFDGSMSPEDYDKMMAAYESDKDHRAANSPAPKDDYGPPDADLKAGKVLKIRFFDVHGVYALQTDPFSAEWLKFETTAATGWIDGCKPDTGYAGWTLFEWNEQKQQWWPYRDSKNQERLYDTGRRPGHMLSSSKSNRPVPAKQHRRKNLERG